MMVAHTTPLPFTPMTTQPTDQQCTDAKTPYDDTVRCDERAVLVCWSEAPGFERRQYLCRVHANIFIRMCLRWNSDFEIHVEPFTVETTRS